MVSLLKGLAEEKVVLIKLAQAAKLPFPLGSGIVRLVDEKGHTLGLVLNQEMIEEIEEEIECGQPGFLASLEASRRSGRMSGETVRKKVLG